MKFAKLFDVNEDAQVLATRVLDEEDVEAPYKLRIATDYRGIYLEATMGFKDEHKCDQAFELFDGAKAKEFFIETIAIVEEADEEFEKE